MKILLLGDASNYHNCLSVGLARAGHEVTVASNGSRWMGTARDIDISRGKGKLSGAILWAKLNTILSSKLKGYDVVQIHNPVFLDLRPNRVRQIFDKLRRDNGGVFLTALGTDPQYVEMLLGKDCPLKYSEYMVDNRPTAYYKSEKQNVRSWLDDELYNHSQYIYDNIDGAVTALYEYQQSCLRHLPAEKVTYAGIPVDTSLIPYTPLPNDISKVQVLVACHKGREGLKGIDYLMPVLKDIEREYPRRISVNLVQNVPFAQFQSHLNAAHIVVDQLYSYTPATTALMAMAMGKVVVSGGEPDYYDFIGEKELRPIINPEPDRLKIFYNQMVELIKHPSRLAEMSLQSHEFALKHNDVDVVARRFIDFWERRLR